MSLLWCEIVFAGIAVTSQASTEERSGRPAAILLAKRSIRSQSMSEDVVEMFFLVSLGVSLACAYTAIALILHLGRRHVQEVD